MSLPEARVLDAGWEAAGTAPDACPTPDGLDGLTWIAARVPGTAAAALCDCGSWAHGDAHDFDARDWWFRVRFDGDEGAAMTLCLDGVATAHEAYLNGVLILSGSSMFQRSRVPVVLAASNELAIRCRALGPLLAVPRKPRARWRQQLVDGNLRWWRTMLLGRAPGFAPGPATVGPWRPVRLEPAGGDGDIRVHASLRGDDGIVAVSGSPAAHSVELSGPSGTQRAALAGGALVIADVARWWPHTHGEPVLHDVRVHDAAGTILAERRVGFRAVSAGATRKHDVERDGLDLHVNGVPVFARGAVWTPVDPVGMAPAAADLRAALEQVRDAGMNLVRVVGTGAYESPAFHEICDELGILVWQDCMFANLDYPVADDAFRAAVTGEVRQLLGDVGGRASTIVVCGNSEVEQQAAMLGLDPALGRGELFGELLPGLVTESGCDAIYLPSAPCGGDLPFRTDAGVANYFGVGGYRRPLEDARRAAVRFASECLALANVPDEATLDGIGLDPAGDLFDDPRWKAAVPGDQGTDWDFDDVRDHYLALLHHVDPAALRREDRARYLALSRQVTGELMAEVFGEWRRAGSPCGGGIVLWLRDLLPGAGWGLVDATGRPKVAYHHLRRALAPVAVWTTDEGQNGVDVHIANDGPRALETTLRVALYRDGEHSIADVNRAIVLEPHSIQQSGVEQLLGRFVDAAYAFRFGPPGHDAVVATLEDADGIRSQSFRFPAGPPRDVRDAADLGLRAAAAALPGGQIVLRLDADRLVYGLRIDAPGLVPGDDAFSLEPGHGRSVVLQTGPDTADPPAVILLSALNLRGTLAVRVEGHQR